MVLVQTDQQLVDHVTHLLDIAKGKQRAGPRTKGILKVNLAKNDEAVYQLTEMLKLVQTHLDQARKPSAKMD
jgi:hypothetical protein